MKQTAFHPGLLEMKPAGSRDAMIMDNPVKRLSQSRAWYRVERRQSFIKPHELKPWYEGVCQLGNDTLRDYLLLLVFTGLRRQEGAKLKWKQVDQWHTLMKKEKYVCLAGSFGEVTPKTVNGKTLLVYGWIYDKLKTKKGCSAYWDDCDRTYQQFLEDKAIADQWKKRVF